jgi:pilus assembly protein CpaC
VLEVRVLEATKSHLQDLGLSGVIQNNAFQFSFGGGLIGTSQPAGGLHLIGSGSTSVDMNILALEEKGLIRTLARPNLVALSGEKATFHAGGEYPYPVPQRDNLVTLEFRKYGVELTFTPVVEDNGLIRLDVEPSVSQLDFTNALRVLGFTVPALTIRTTHTVVELKEGQSLAVGGLIQQDYTNSLRQIPGIGNVPILSALLRSSRWNRNESELLVIVTPRLTNAADMAAAAKIKSPPGRPEPKPGDLFLNGATMAPEPKARGH